MFPTNVHLKLAMDELSLLIYIHQARVFMARLHTPLTNSIIVASSCGANEHSANRKVKVANLIC